MEATLTINAGDADEKLIHHIARSRGMTDRQFLELLLNEALAHVLWKHRSEVTHTLLLDHQLDELIVAQSDKDFAEKPAGASW